DRLRYATPPAQAGITGAHQLTMQPDQSSQAVHGDEQEADQNDLAALAHAMVMFAHMPFSSSQPPACIGSSPRSKV
ncbi:hypothetical protein, partial [Sphingomonas trueperi]